MKTLILSDVHSNVRGLQSIWRIESDSDRIYCAGDLVGYGPDPGETIEWLMAHEVACVRGNHDLGLAEYYRRPGGLGDAPPIDWARLHHNASSLSEEHVSFLERLPVAVTFSLDGIACGMTHAADDAAVAAGSVEAHGAFVAQRFQPGPDGPIARVIHGHSHSQTLSRPGQRRVWLNPGPAIEGQPDPTNPGNYVGFPDGRAYYSTITDGRIELKHVEYHG